MDLSIPMKESNNLFNPLQTYLNLIEEDDEILDNYAVEIKEAKYEKVNTEKIDT